jgi:hypothetical protein
MIPDVVKSRLANVALEKPLLQVNTETLSLPTLRRIFLLFFVSLSIMRMVFSRTIRTGNKNFEEKVVYLHLP